LTQTVELSGAKRSGEYNATLRCLAPHGFAQRAVSALIANSHSPTTGTNKNWKRTESYAEHEVYFTLEPPFDSKKVKGSKFREEKKTGAMSPQGGLKRKVV